MKKLIFRFNNKTSKNNFSDKKVLGGKGANLAQMAKLGLPVPPGFTLNPVTESPLSPAAVGPRYVISDPVSTLNVSKVASIVRVAMIIT